MKYKIKYKFWLKNGTYLEEVVEYDTIQDVIDELKEHEEHIWEVVCNKKIGRLGVGRLRIITNEIIAYTYEDITEPDIFASEEAMNEVDEILKQAWEEA